MKSPFHPSLSLSNEVKLHFYPSLSLSLSPPNEMKSAFYPSLSLSNEVKSPFYPSQIQKNKIFRISKFILFVMMEEVVE